MLSALKEDFGLECVSAGNRGPMSMDKVHASAEVKKEAKPLS